VGPVFDLDKLAWLNGHYIRALPTSELADRIVSYLGVDGEKAELVRRATPHVQERMSVLREAREMLGFLADEEFAIDPAAGEKFLGVEPRPTLQAARDAIAGLSDWSTAAIEDALRRALVDGLGLKPKHAFGPVRVAVTGRTVSPPLFESIELLGKAEALGRLDAALAP